jgi:hypothetical protein
MTTKIHKEKQKTKNDEQHSTHQKQGVGVNTGAPDG